MRKEIAGQRLHIRDPHLKPEQHDRNASQRRVRRLRARRKNSKRHHARGNRNRGLARRIHAQSALRISRPASHPPNSAPAAAARYGAHADTPICFRSKCRDFLQIRRQPQHVQPPDRVHAEPRQQNSPRLPHASATPHTKRVAHLRAVTLRLAFVNMRALFA